MSKRKTTIQDDNGALFDWGTPEANGTPQAAPEEHEPKVFEQLAELRRMVEQTGEYVALPNDAILTRGETYFNTHVEKLQTTLQGSGTSADTVTAVINDYARVLTGSYSPTATPKQMIEALRKLKPYKAYSIDRYGVYFALLLNYSRCLNKLAEYNENVKGSTANTATIRDYMDGVPSASGARAVTWLLDVGVMVPADFAGIEPADVSAFLATVKDWANLGDYVTFYFIAKYALLATPEELAEITRPPIHSATPIIDYAEQAAELAQQRLDETADKFADMFEAERQADQEQTEAEARAAGRDWKNDANNPIPTHQIPNIILSRPVEISISGRQLMGAAPIQRYIDKFTTTEGNTRYGLITPFTVQKVVEAINILPHFLKQTNEDGQLMYYTTMNEFAELCGYIDANQEQQRALLGGLLVISDQYFVVNRPYRVVTKEYKNGNKRRITTGGPTVTQLVHVKYEVETNGLVIIIDPDAMKGKPTLIQETEYKALRVAAGKNLSRSRFNAQILSKGHKDVDDMLNEVFGYDEKLKLCKDDPEAMKRAKRDIRQHKPRNRAKLFEWFEETQAAGIITYTFNEKTNAVSWERLSDPTDTDEQ